MSRQNTFTSIVMCIVRTVVVHSSTLHVFFLDLNSLGPDDGPVRTETCSPTANKVYVGHLHVVLDGYINSI